MARLWRRSVKLIGAMLVILPLPAVSGLSRSGEMFQDVSSRRSTPREEAKATYEPQRFDAPGIENAFRLSPRLYSGAEPRGEKAFQTLKSFGIKTIITVDGAFPDIELAHKDGMRYIHIPVGYDGISRMQAVRLVQAIKTQPGPVFIHCHHGKHRGPTAAAICGLSSEGWTRDQAFAWLKAAGTSPDYRGLFASVEAFQNPSAEDLGRVGKDFPEQVPVAALVEAMVEIDQRWDRLKAFRESGYQPPPADPEIDPQHEALLLAEGFQEILRLDETKEKGGDFTERMSEAERLALAVLEELRIGKPSLPKSRKPLDQAFAAVTESCKSCHARHRD